MARNQWAAPEREVLMRAGHLLDEGVPAVLATVVAVEGTAYRRPGAKMLVTPDGTGVGSVTAGCLEDELTKLAADVLASGEPRVETYDLMADDDDDVWGLGVGCNGVIDVLLEPLGASLDPVVRAAERREPIGVVTVVDGEPPTGARTFYRPGEGFGETFGPVPTGVTSAIEADVETLVERDASDVVEVESDAGSAAVFVDSITPPPELVVVGSGHDVAPVAELGTDAGFEVSVIGYRGANATEERFPAAETVRSTSPTNLTDVTTMDGETYVVVMTHNFVDDRLTLAALLETEVPYIGVLGPRERFENILDALADDGDVPTGADFDRIYTPVGLDLGGGTPYQIALSIVGEVVAVANGRDPGHLRDRDGPIHERVELQ